MAFFLRPGYFEDHADEWECDDYPEDDSDDYPELYADEFDPYYDTETWNPPSEAEMIALFRCYGSSKAVDWCVYYFKTCRIYAIPHRCRIYDVYTCVVCDKPLQTGDHRDCLPF